MQLAADTDHKPSIINEGYIYENDNTPTDSFVIWHREYEIITGVEFNYIYYYKIATAYIYFCFAI